MGWVKHTLPASADSSLRSGSNLTTFHHVKLDCLGWIRSDLFRSTSAVTHHFVFFEMVTKSLIVHFFQLDNLVACLPLRVGVSPFSPVDAHCSTTVLSEQLKAALRLSQPAPSLLWGVFHQAQAI